MKKILYSILIIILMAAILITCDKKEETENPGSIYGVVSDQLTKETLQEVTVSLSEKQQHITGSDGRYEFKDLSERSYTLKIFKSGYKAKEGKVSVAAGKNTPFNFSIEKLQPILTVTDDNRKPVTSLNFGENTTTNFNIYNDGDATLVWSLNWDCSWIKQVSVSKGELQPTKVAGVVVTIDRNKLSGGTNTSKLHILATGITAKELTIIATGDVKTQLNTLTPTEITTTTATLNGEIFVNGTPAYEERGFVYSIFSPPTVESTIEKVIAPLTTSKTFSRTVTGLTLGQTYYVRAYAINSADTAYSSNEVNFKPEMVLATITTQEADNKNIAAGTATFNGTIISGGDPAYTERGFVYSTQYNPTVGNGTKVESGGSGTGSFSQPITELIEGNIYYVRAYAKNAKDYAYGDEVVLNFNAVLPDIVTKSATETSTTSAIFTATITHVGDPAYTERGFVYATIANPSLSTGTKLIVDGVGTGNYNKEVTDLTNGTTYYVKAYATDNGEHTNYGNQISFTLSMPEYITLTTEKIMVETQDRGYTMWTVATSVCSQSVLGGYTDWRLPNRDELTAIYGNKSSIGGFTTTAEGCDACHLYWTSVEYVPYRPSNQKFYYIINFSTASEHSRLATLSGSVRCVRSLP